MGFGDHQDVSHRMLGSSHQQASFIQHNDDAMRNRRSHSGIELPQPSLDAFVQKLLDTIKSSVADAGEQAHFRQRPAERFCPNNEMVYNPRSSDFTTTSVVYGNKIDAEEFSNASSSSISRQAAKGKSLLSQNPIHSNLMDLKSSSSILRKVKTEPGLNPPQKSNIESHSIMEKERTIWNHCPRPDPNEPYDPNVKGVNAIWNVEQSRRTDIESSDPINAERYVKFENDQSDSPEWKRQVRIVESTRGSESDRSVWPDERSTISKTRGKRKSEGSRSRSRSPSHSSRFRYFRWLEKHHSSPSRHSNHSPHRPQKSQSPMEDSSFSPAPKEFNHHTKTNRRSLSRKNRSSSPPQPPSKRLKHSAPLQQQPLQQYPPVQQYPSFQQAPLAANPNTPVSWFPTISSSSTNTLPVFSHQNYVTPYVVHPYQEQQQQAMKAVPNSQPPKPSQPPNSAPAPTLPHIQPQNYHNPSTIVPIAGSSKKKEDVNQKKRHLRDEHLNKQSKLIHQLFRLQTQQSELAQKQNSCNVESEKKQLEGLIIENAKLQKEIISSIQSLEKIIMKYTKLLNDDLDQVKNSHLKSVQYRFFDPGQHWCALCNVILANFKDYLDHSLSGRHKNNMQANKKDQQKKHMEEKVKVHQTGVGTSNTLPTEMVPFQGSQYLRPVEAWYCDVCQVCVGDAQSTVAHMSSIQHSDCYLKFRMEQPELEMKHTLSMQLALRRDIKRKKNKAKKKKKNEEEKKKQVEKDQQSCEEQFIDPEKSTNVPAAELEDPAATLLAAEIGPIVLNISTPIVPSVSAEIIQEETHLRDIVNQQCESNEPTDLSSALMNFAGEHDFTEDSFQLGMNFEDEECQKPLKSMKPFVELVQQPIEDPVENYVMHSKSVIIPCFEDIGDAYNTEDARNPEYKGSRVVKDNFDQLSKAVPLISIANGVSQLEVVTDQEKASVGTFSVEKMPLSKVKKEIVGDP